MIRSVLAFGLLLPLSVRPTSQLASPNVVGMSAGHAHLNVADIDVHNRLCRDRF